MVVLIELTKLEWATQDVISTSITSPTFHLEDHHLQERRRPLFIIKVMELVETLMYLKIMEA